MNTGTILPNFYSQRNKINKNQTEQSGGNMPPLPPRQLLPHIIQIMPRNPKYDQFQWKGHHHEEYPQSTTKINIIWSFSYRFWRWSGYISMQNVRPFPRRVLQEMTGTPKFDSFHYVEIVPKFEKSTDQDHKLISLEGGQETSAYKIISGHSFDAFSRNARNHKFDPFY